MSKLRNDKAELEEKIQDLETRISQQSVDMEELERRADMHKKSAERAKVKCTSCWRCMSSNRFIALASSGAQYQI